MIRRFLLAASLLSTTLVACGDDGGGAVTPTGPHYHYVVNKVNIPKSTGEARMNGLDVDGMAGVDNRLGEVLATLQGMFDLQVQIDNAINSGSINLLVNLQTPDFSSAGGAGVAVQIGENPMPAPCTDMNDPATCGKHLTGSGMFSLSANSPDDAALTGKVVNGVFNGGPGDVLLKLNVAGANIDLALIGAKAQLSGMSEGKIDTAIIAGAVTKEDLDTKVIPAIHMQVSMIMEADCPGSDPAASPACGCADGSTGKQIQSAFDTMPKDCDLTVDEIQNNGLIMSFLKPDVTVNGQMALSLGLKVSKVKATYTDPNE